MNEFMNHSQTVFTLNLHFLRNFVRKLTQEIIQSYIRVVKQYVFPFHLSYLKYNTKQEIAKCSVSIS